MDTNVQCLYTLMNSIEEHEKEDMIQECSTMLTNTLAKLLNKVTNKWSNIEVNNNGEITDTKFFQKNLNTYCEKQGIKCKTMGENISKLEIYDMMNSGYALAKFQITNIQLSDLFKQSTKNKKNIVVNREGVKKALEIQ